jgi:hypothetical protein
MPLRFAAASSRPNLVHVSAAVGMVGCIVNPHRLREWIGDALVVLDEVVGNYEALVKCFLDNQEDRDKVAREIDNGLLWPRPWLALNLASESSGTVNELVDRGVLQPMTRDTLRACTSEDDPVEQTTFHRHQTDSFGIANRRQSHALTAGSGSGKSMAYIVPIIDRLHVRGQVQGGTHG